MEYRQANDIIQELHKLNAGLTNQLCHQQSICKKQSLQIFYLNEDNEKNKKDLQNSRNHIAALEGLLMQLQQQQQIPNPFFRKPHLPELQQQSEQRTGLPKPSSLIHSNGEDPPPPPLPRDAPFIEHRTAGTLHSPSKNKRRPLADVLLKDENAPLKISDVLQRRPDVKRAPIHSPPAKQAPKRQANGPTPQKIAESNVAVEQQDPPVKLDKQKLKSFPTMTLGQLQTAEWKESEKAPYYKACRPLLTAIFEVTAGDVAILKTAIDWLVKNVPLCRTIQTAQAENGDAAIVAENIEYWLQHNMGKYRKKGGTLPSQMEQAIQTVASAVLFNPTRPMDMHQVQRVLPTISGKQKLRRLKKALELNQTMINENKTFTTVERKQRKDAFWPLLCLFVRRKICWNDKYTKVDTNYSRKIKCKEPQIEELEGGGWRLTGWKTVEREMRMWYEETKLDDVLRLVLNSDEWKQLTEEYAGLSLGKNALRLALCPSVRKPTFRSCVNEKMSALGYLMEDFYSVIKNSTTLRKRIDECPCERHRTARYMKEMGYDPPPLWHEQLRCLPSRFCGMATCAKKEQPELQVGDQDPPKLRDKRCTTSTCEHCGFARKLGLSGECTAFTECNELMEVTLWAKAKRNGGRFQLEPTRFTGADRKTVADVYDILVDKVAPVALDHLGEAQWWHAQTARVVASFEQDEMILFTDFSATPELVAKEVGNCHEAEHCVIDIFVVLDNPRMVKVVNKDGQVVEKRINDCTYWSFLGPTDGKGKKNDHRFHREAFKSIAKFHEEKARKRSVILTKAKLLSDNCSGQYKNQFGMGDTAWFAETFPGIRLEHWFAPVYEFKGVHDGFGKVIKWKFKEAELKGIRIANALLGYYYLIENYTGRRLEWERLEQEASPKLLQRGAFQMTEARAGYIADSLDEVESIKQEKGGEHVLYCDRERVPRTVGDKAAEGLTDIYSMRGKRESILMDDKGDTFWELELSTRACGCKVCSARDSNNNQRCPYHDLRGVKTITVSDQSTSDEWCLDQRAKRSVSVYFRKHKKFTGYVNIAMMAAELKRIEKPFPPNARRKELTHIFLSMQEDSIGSEEEETILALEEEIQQPPEPSLDDDLPDANELRDLPLSEEEAPTCVDLLGIDDIEEEGIEDYSVSDQELRDVTDFAVFDDRMLNHLLAQRQLPTEGSREQLEERLVVAIKTF